MAMESGAKKISELMSAIKEDYLIKVFVAEHPKPYLVQATVLASISKFFDKALKNQDHFGNEKGVLRLPEDDRIAWERLLYWKTTGKIEDDEDEDERSIVKITRLVASWIIAHKYDVEEFQDLVMLELIVAMRKYKKGVPFAVIKLSFDNTPHGSELRTLMAQRAIYDYAEGSSDPEDFDKLHGLSGFIAAMVRAYDRKDCYGVEDLLANTSDGESWKEFMVKGGPEKHWIHN